MAFAVVLLLMLTLLAGCDALFGERDDVAVQQVDLDTREVLTLEAPEDVITYAYLPQYSHTTSYTRHRLLLDYLRRETGLPLQQVFPETFDEHIMMARHGAIDISFSNPVVYVRMTAHGAQAFARVVEPSGRPSFRGQIIARADNDAITTVASCRGARWIAVDPASAGGFLFPLGLFQANGLSLEDFADVDFAPGPGGKQEKVILAVHSGAYDIGSIREGALDVIADTIPPGDIRVVAQTPFYPGWVYAARQGLPAAVREAVAAALLALDPDNPHDALILETAGFQNIIPADDADYADVRRLMENLGMLTPYGGSLPPHPRSAPPAEHAGDADRVPTGGAP